MTTQLLEGPQTGSGAQQTISEAIPREPIYPGRVKLSAKLAEFERSEADLEDYKGRAARAARDEERALEDQELDESAVAERITRAQNERNVYKARQAQREKAIAALSVELASAINECSGELRQLINLEVNRRKEIVTARVLEAIEAIGGGARREMALAHLLEFSGPVQRVAVLGPAPYIYSVRDTGLTASAKSILEAFEQLTIEMRREI